MEAVLKYFVTAALYIFVSSDSWSGISILTDVAAGQLLLVSKEASQNYWVVVPPTIHPN